MSKALARKTQGGVIYEPPEFSPQQLEILTRVVCPGATRDELFLFVYVCKRIGLDPFAKQIYGIKRGGKLTIQTSIDGYRLTAHRTGQYAGQEDAEYGPTINSDGVDHPEWAKVTVHKLFGPNRVAFSGTARWKEFRQCFNGTLGEKWREMPFHMLAKCAEAQALRKGFPAELGGVYVEDELPPAQAIEQTVTVPAAATGKDLIAAPTKAYFATKAHEALGKALLQHFKGNKEEAANELERLTTFSDAKGRVHRGVRSVRYLSAEAVKEITEKRQTELKATQADVPFPD